MKKHFYFTTEDQLDFKSKHKLECEVGTTTYFTEITEDSTHIFLLISKDTGEILKKWTFVNDVCVFVSKPTTKDEDELTKVDCDSAKFEDGVTCADICNNDNIKCFLCERNKD